MDASKTKTIIVSRSCTIHPQSPPLTIGGTVLKVSDDLIILGVTFDSKLTFETPGCSGWIISVGYYADNSFAAILWE